MVPVHCSVQTLSMHRMGVENQKKKEGEPKKICGAIEEWKKTSLIVLIISTNKSFEKC